jgi:type I restriction enzyme, S subunit
VEGNGNPQEIGRAAVWDGSIENCVHQNHLIRVRCNPEMLVPEFLVVFINSESGKRYFLGAGNTTSGLVTINTTKVKECRIPVPPIGRQRDFAARVAEVREIEARQVEARQRLDDLFASLLHRAFRGEL